MKEFEQNSYYLKELSLYQNSRHTWHKHICKNPSETLSIKKEEGWGIGEMGMYDTSWLFADRETVILSSDSCMHFTKYLLKRDAATNRTLAQ